MKSCELCKLAARTYCESDQACLCWDCDSKVHGANFLVARHVRGLLCNTCQSLTPWRAAGAKLGQTLSVCERCVNGSGGEESEAENDEGDGDEDYEEDAGSDDGSSVDVDVEEDGDNQVVPWSKVSNTPPPATSSSSSEDSASSEREASKSTNAFSLKRSRENASDLCSQDDLDRLSPKRRYGYRTVLATRCRPEDEAVSVDSTRMSKDQQIKPESPVQSQSEPRGTVSTESLDKN